jgi:tRNA (Thr-GGU) A37 N-methylase
MTRVRVLKVEDSRLVVEGLDAHDGSPILDMKSG